LKKGQRRKRKTGEGDHEVKKERSDGALRMECGITTAAAAGRGPEQKKKRHTNARGKIKKNPFRGRSSRERLGQGKNERGP